MDRKLTTLYWLKFNAIEPTLCHGCFDLLHLGHVRHFQAAKKLGGLLVVTITPDRFITKPGRPAFGERLRAEMVAALECVDYVAINEWPDAVETIRVLRPAIYAKGIEYQDNMTPALLAENEAVESVGGRLVFCGDDLCHSTELLKLAT